MNQTQSQKEAILKHLLQNRTITPMQALDMFGCFRLSARIWDLEQEGHLINHKKERVAGKSFAVYSLINADKNGQVSLF